jgi:glycosyltransferase involved in cell wall biosynthesis
MTHSSMKLLLCCPLPWVDAKFGASRVALDLADGLNNLDLPCDFFPPMDNHIGRLEYSDVLADHLIAHAADYNVVDYHFHVRPWVQDCPGSHRVLKVARVVLMPHLEDRQPDPVPPNTFQRRFRRLARKLLGKTEPVLYDATIRRMMDQNLHEADLISVANTQDRECLIELGFPPSKIAVIPYGLTTEGAKALAAANRKRPSAPPTLVFVGTFDFRKGCLDFPDIVARVLSRHPEAKFRLLGTKGMFQTKAKVLSHFPGRMHRHLEIHPVFEPDALPELLADCHIGFFPSYREGFGIAVVEMLGAGLPVVAYDAAGPCDILPEEWKVPRGDRLALADRLIEILADPDTDALRAKAAATAARFQWDDLARQTWDRYAQELQAKQKGKGERP